MHVDVLVYRHFDATVCHLAAFLPAYRPKTNIRPVGQRSLSFPDPKAWNTLTAKLSADPTELIQALRSQSQAVLLTLPIDDVTSTGMEQATHSQQETRQESDAMVPESTVLLNSAAEAGNWQLVKDLISNGDITFLNIQQASILQKLASATEVSHQLVKDILLKLFSNEEQSARLKKVAQDAVLEAAKNDNWSMLMTFLMAVDCVLEDEASLFSLLELMSSSHTLTEMPYLHTDVLSAVWGHSHQTILNSKDRRVHNIFVQLAAKLSMWSRVCDVLVTKPDLNLLDRDGLSVLHRLVMCPDSRFDSLLPVLLEHGADVNLKNAQGDGVLHLAATNQKFPHAPGCLRKADRNNSSTSEHFESEIMKKYQNMCAGSKRQALANLINHCDNVDDRDKGGSTAVMLAAKNDNWEFVRLLMDHGARADLADDCKRSVLHILALSESPMDITTYGTLVNVSLNRGAQVNSADLNGDSVPHLAVKSKNWALLSVLIALEANLEFADSAGYSFVHRLAMTETEHAKEVAEIFSLLSRQGANIELPCADGNTALLLAARQHNWELVKHLVHLGANVRHCNMEGLTAVHHLAVSESRSRETLVCLHVQLYDPEHTDVMCILDLLLEKGGELEARCSNGETALHVAARHGNWVMVRHLFQRGAKLHDLDGQGRHIAERLIECECGTDACETDVVLRVFLDSYAATHAIEGPNWDSILQLAAKYEKWRIVDHVLRCRGGSVDQSYSEGLSVVHRMVTSRSETFKAGWSSCYAKSVLDRSKILDKPRLVSLIHQAAAAGNVDIVDALLDNLEDVNKTDGEGLTVLHRVAQCCVSTSVALIRRLVEKGADVNKQCPSGDTALHLAAKSGNWLVVQHLLKSGALASALDSEGMSVLHRLMAQSHLRCKQCVKNPSARKPAKLLAAMLSKRALISQRDFDGNTPLHLAVKNEHWDMASELLFRRAPLKECDAGGCTVLHTLAKRLKCHTHECSPFIQPCLQMESSPTVTCDANDTLPSGNGCVACSIDDDVDSMFLFSSRLKENLNHLFLFLHLFDFLFDSTTPIDAVDSDGNTALLLSAKYSNWDITQQLLLKGANPFSVDHRGFSVLHVLASQQSTPGESYGTEAVKRNLRKQFIKQRTDITRRDAEGNTAIQVAAKHGNMDMVEELLKFHRNVNDVDSHGFTLLCRAAMTSSPICKKIVCRLLQRGADVNITCPEGHRPLLLSVLYNNWPIALLLLRRRANRDILFQKKSLLIQCLLEDTNSEETQEDKSKFLFTLVISKTVDIATHRSSDGKSVLQHAFMTKQWNTARILLQQTACLDPESLAGEYVFHALAAMALQVKDEKWILPLMPHRNFNINLRDGNGETPLSILAKNYQWNLVRRFVKLGADVNMPDSQGWTVVHRLAEQNVRLHGENFILKLLELFLEEGADINTTGPAGKTAVILALGKEKWKMFWRLIHAGAQIDWAEADKCLILENVCHIPSRYAQDNNLKHAVKSILKHFSKAKYSPEKTTQSSALRAIEKCVRFSNWTMAELLLHYGPEIDFNVILSGKPLLFTMLSSYTKRNHQRWVSFLDALIDKGLDINVRDNSGKTVLMTQEVMLCLVSHKPPAFIEVLLQRGANPLLVDSTGRSLLTNFVHGFGWYSLRPVTYLLELGVIPYERFLEGARTISASPMKITVQRKDVNLLKILLECGASSNSEVFALNTECQKNKAQAEGNRRTEELEQVCEILGQAATRPRSLESLCRLAVLRCLPCSLSHKDHVRSLPVPALLKSYLLFADVLPDSVVQTERNESSDED